MITLKFDQVNTLPEEAGIYMIQNVLNGKKYIGSTNCFKRRLTRHRSELRMGIHHAIHLQRAYNKYGEDKFIIAILEKCEPIHDTLLMIEQKYLDLLPEYNSNKNATRKYSKIPVIKINKVKKKIDQYDLNYNYVRTFDSISDASRSFNLPQREASIHTAISKCCMGKMPRAMDYYWKYSDDTRNIRDIIKVNSRPGKRIDQLDLNGNYIRTFDNMLEAASYLGSVANRSSINNVCLGKNKTAFGYKWRYAS